MWHGRCDCPAHLAEDNWRWLQSWELRRRTNSGEVRPTLAAGPGPEPGAGVLLFCLRSPRLGASESSPQCGPCLERAGDQSSGQCLGHSSQSPWRCCPALGQWRPGRGQPPQPPAASGQDQRLGTDCQARGRCFIERTLNWRPDLRSIG